MATIETTGPSRELESREKQAVEREGTRAGRFFRPDVDILETADQYVVTADMPGVDETHVHVRVQDGLLRLEATPAWEPEGDWAPLHREYQAGGYRREFALSEGIDTDQIQAAMRNGVLELRLPKERKHQPRTIEVQAG